MIKKIFLIIVLIFLLNNLLAISISEVELNPLGDDAGNEWVELYSSTNVNLDGYKLVSHDGTQTNLTGSFQGYWIYTFTKQGLDNANERVFLYKGNQLIDQTGILVDSANNDKTWQFCTNWTFADSTKGTKNCEKQVIKEEPKITIHNDSENLILDDNLINIDSINTTENKTQVEQTNSEKVIEKTTETINSSTLEILKLNSQPLKTEKESNVKELATLSLFTFCLLLGFLFLLKITRYKNEFD